MKAVKKDDTHYYNIIEGYFDDFVQTPLTQNGNLGGDSFAVTGWGGNYSGTPYNAVYPQTGNYSCYSKGGQPGVTFNLYTPKPTIINSFTYHAVWGNYSDSYVYIRLRGSNDNSTWTTLYPQTALHEGTQTPTFDNYTPFQYYELYVLTTGGGGHDGINVYNVRLIGKEYSYSKEEVFDPHFVETKYYKYFDHGFVQPYLTYNGTMGKDKFAAKAITEYSSSYQAYMAFDSSLSTEWASSGTQNPSWISFYNPKPLKVSNLEMRNRTSAENFTGGSVYGSNDNAAWTKLCDYSTTVTSANAYWSINVNSPDFYNYYKIEGTSMTGTNQGFTDIGILAQERDVVETNQSEYKHYNIREIGAITNNNGVLSGFSTNTYANLPILFEGSTYNTWEICIKCTTPSSLSSYHNAFSLGYDCNLVSYLDSSTLKLYIGQGSNWNIANGNVITTLSPETTYWLKYQFTGSAYNVYISTDGINYTLGVSINSTAKLSNSLTVNLGFRQAYTGEYWMGSIDLNESYIKVNDEYWWKGVDVLTISDPIADADFSEDVYNYNTTKVIPEYKVQKELTERKYWKYTYNEWTQPIMSSNSQDGITLSATNFNSSNLYTLMNGVSNSDYICPTSGTSFGSTYQIDLDYKIKLSSISVNSYVQTNVTYGFTTFKVVALVGGQEVDITPANVGSDGGWSTRTLQINDIMTNRVIIYCSSGGSPQPRLGEITLTGLRQNVIEGTPSDYDFYTGGRHYYKYDTENPNYNIDTVGTLTNNNGVLSGFSSGNYAKLKRTLNLSTSEDYEIVFRFNLTTYPGEFAQILYSNLSSYGYRIAITQSGKFHFIHNTSPSAVTVEKTGNVTYSLDTDYFIKFKHSAENNLYIVEYSTDGENYLEDLSFTSTGQTSGNYLSTTIGLDSQNNRWNFTGSIDLKESYIKVNDEYWWQGVTYPVIDGTEQDYDFYIDSNKYLAIKSYEKGQYYGN